MFYAVYEVSVVLDRVVSSPHLFTIYLYDIINTVSSNRGPKFSCFKRFVFITKFILFCYPHRFTSSKNY
jgi:hypothetical protein